MSEKGNKTKQLICDQAYALFAQHGFHKVTMKDICEATGLSRGGLYGHYESTAHIFAEIMSDMMTRQLSDFSTETLTGTTATQTLTTVLNFYKAEILDSDASLSLAMYEYYSQFPKDQENNALTIQYISAKKKWSKFIQLGIKAGEFNPVDIDAIFDLLSFSYQGMRMYSTIAELDEKIPIRMINTIKTLIIKN